MNGGLVKGDLVKEDSVKGDLVNWFLSTCYYIDDQLCKIFRQLRLLFWLSL